MSLQRQNFRCVNSPKILRKSINNMLTRIWESRHQEDATVVFSVFGKLNLVSGPPLM